MPRRAILDQWHWPNKIILTNYYYVHNNKFMHVNLVYYALFEFKNQ